MVQLDELHLLEQEAHGIACAECPCHLAVVYCEGCDQLVCIFCYREHNADEPCHVDLGHERELVEA